MQAAGREGGEVMSEMDEIRFYDLVYDAWRSGRNPDAIDRDRYDDKRAMGFYPDEITLDDVCPKRKQEEAEDKKEEK